MQDLLASKLRNNTQIINQELGWIFAPWLTDRIDLVSQRAATKLVAHQLSKYPTGSTIDCVTAVPIMGLPFATTLAEEMGLDLYMSRKSQHAPRTWESPIVVANKPYKHRGGVAHHAYNVIPGQHLLLVDDVLGEAETAAPVIENLRKHGANIDFAAFYIIKRYRPGYEKLLSMGVQPIGAIDIRSISSKGEFDIEKVI